MQEYLYQDLYALEDTHWWHRAKRQLCVELFHKCHIPKIAKILDVGCGTGKNMETFARFGQVWGIDNSQYAIDFCKKRKLAKVTLAGAEKTKFAQNTFDFVTMLDVLEHTEDRQVLDEMKRILKPQGYLLLSVPAFTWLWSQWDEVLHHKRRYTKKSLVSLLEQKGFSVTFVSYAFSFLILPILLIRRIKSLFPTSEYASDFRITHPLLNILLSFVCTLERFIIFTTTLPLGSSIFCLARVRK